MGLILKSLANRTLLVPAKKSGISCTRVSTTSLCQALEKRLRVPKSDKTKRLHGDAFFMCATLSANRERPSA